MQCVESDIRYEKAQFMLSESLKWQLGNMYKTLIGNWVVNYLLLLTALLLQIYVIKASIKMF